MHELAKLIRRKVPVCRTAELLGRTERAVRVFASVNYYQLTSLESQLSWQDIRDWLNR